MTSGLRRHPWVTSLLLAVLTVPFGPAAPSSGIDYSWGFALHAWTSGSNGAVPVTYFNYGPLGFLTLPTVWNRTTYGCAVLFFVLVQVALCRVVLARLLRVVPWPVAVAVALVLAASVDNHPAELLVLVLALGATELLESGVTRPRAWLLGGSTFTGLVLLVKFSTGVISLLLLLVMTVALSTGGLPRRIGTAATSAALALGVSWLAFGLLTGGWGAFPGWLRGSKEVAGGYTAMAYEPARGGVGDYVLAVPMMVALFAVAVVLALRTRARTQVVSAATLGLATYLAFREGFTRHDTGHLMVLGSALLLLPLALTLGGRGRLLLLPMLAGPLAFSLWQTGTVHPAESYDLAGNVGRLANRVHLVVDAAPTQERARVALKQAFDVPPAVVEALRGHRVQVDPWDTGVLWAYGLRWGPSSVWALYSGYTPWLDDANARSLSATGGPDRILRALGPAAVDGRVANFESPAYQLEELCRWRQVLREGRWQVLERGPDRCAPPTLLSSVTLMPGHPVTVPAPRTPGSVVTVRLSLRTPLSYRLQALLFKPWVRHRVTLNGTARHVVVATLGQPLVLVVPEAESPLAGLPGSGLPFAVTTIATDLPGTAVFEEHPITG